jgi:hypothetical protein
MSDIAELYADQVHDNLKPLYANWDVSTPRQLGDYGVLDDNIFVQLGNITKDFGVKFTPRTDTRKDTRSFSSKGSTEVNISAQGQAPAGGAKINAKLEINFSSEDAMFFNAAGCEYSMIADKAVVGAEIMKLYNKGDWDRSWVIVTDIVDASAVTVAVSSSKSSAVVFEADASIPNINLADPQLKLSVKSSRNVGFQLAAEQGKNLLLGFCKIRGFFNSVFKPVSNLSLMATMDVPDAKARSREEDLFFGQLE